MALSKPHDWRQRVRPVGRLTNMNRQPVPEPTSMTREEGPSPGASAAIRCNRCSMHWGKEGLGPPSAAGRGQPGEIVTVLFPMFPQTGTVRTQTP